MEETGLFPKVSIVVITHNRWRYTKQCLDSLLNDNEYPHVEIIIVDNASSDETKQRLSEIQNSNIKVIFSPVNTGFSRGNTIGCKAATGDILILLNNDTIVTPGWISRLIRPLMENPDLGMAGPMSNYSGNDQRLDHFIGDSVRGADPDWLDDFYQFYKGRWRYTDFLVFFCVAIKREVYEKAGELDANYGTGMFEDNDYCERVKQAGYKMAIIENTFVYHHGSVSFKQLKDGEYRSLWNKNKSYFEQKWGKTWHVKTPATIFDSFQPQAIAQTVFQAADKTSILVLGEKDWPVIKQRWQYLTSTLAAQDDYLVIAHIYKFNGRLINGIRKVGPSFYITNRLDLFAQTHFDWILYCGETIVRSHLHSRSVIVDGVCYFHKNQGQLPPFKDEDVYHEEHVEQLARKLKKFQF
ncbi:glycosyltransferase family 2 protein [Paenibacillus alkaliterrae]|uniref:glycosyltransferase family 2 protein n=1 Tax=Paenibacillus alkaliterrae TaxID=320909 RepID=UPI001F2964BF|nr:glycosyltransferase family 2 protein [Paenibacillus alkaliterrae]MCF2941699.1 glycosyltransferase family 2 protein [Paenibacillus alkaliterrae]